MNCQHTADRNWWGFDCTGKSTGNVGTTFMFWRRMEYSSNHFHRFRFILKEKISTYYRIWCFWGQLSSVSKPLGGSGHFLSPCPTLNFRFLALILYQFVAVELLEHGSLNTGFARVRDEIVTLRMLCRPYIFRKDFYSPSRLIAYLSVSQTDNYE